MNHAFQEDSEEESEMRSGGHDSTLVAQQCVGLQAASTARGEASCCPSLCNTCPASHSSAACPNRYPGVA